MKIFNKSLLACITVFLVIVHTNAFSQTEGNEEPKVSLKDRFVFGGNLSLSGGTYIFIDISPNVGFYVTPRLLTGLGLTYEYYRERYLGNIYSYNIFGYRVFSSYSFISDLSKLMPVKSHLAFFVHAEFEALNLDKKINNLSANVSTGRYWLYSPLFGIGLKQPLGKKSSFIITLLYNFNNSKNLPYSNPVIRVGFYF
jgi:hypothetical protein